MKRLVIALITLIIGGIASPTFPDDTFDSDITPETQSERRVTRSVRDVVNAVSQKIRDAGLDPYSRDWSVEYALPLPVVFSASAIVDNLQFSGLSNILFQDINYSSLQRRLTFHIFIPAVTTTVDNIKASAVVLGEELSASLRGSVIVTNIRFTADIRFNVRLIGGRNVRSIDLNFILSGIQSNLKVNILGKDVSSDINTILGSTFPDSLYAIRSQIDRFLVGVAWSIVNGERGTGFF